MNHKKLLENFSSHLKNAIANSISHAASLHHPTVLPIHLLYGLINEQGSIAEQLLTKANITDEIISQELLFIKREFDELPLNGKKIITLPMLDDSSKKAVEKAMLLAYDQEHSFVGTEHLLGGLLSLQDTLIIKIIQDTANDSKELQKSVNNALEMSSRFPQMQEIASVAEHIAEQTKKEEIIHEDSDDKEELVSSQKNKLKKHEAKTTSLDYFGTNLTSPEAQANIDPVIGRDDEIERMIHILARRNKNNPILVGEPGVGKTAIVEGLAKRIYSGDVPESLKRKQIYALDLALVVAGTMYRGEFEGRIKQLVEDISTTPNIIVFIDEIHNIVGAGSNQGTMDAANLLKPALARGELRCIGATTHDEYKKHITGDPALERRFQVVHVDEPTKEHTQVIMQGVKPYYEKFHGVEILDTTITTAITMSTKYIHENFLPDKALDLLDEACALVKTKKKINKHQKRVFSLENKLKELQAKKEVALESEELELAITLKEDIKKVTNQISKTNKLAEDLNQQDRPSVTSKDVSYVLAKKLRISQDILNHSEWDQLNNITSELKKHVVGQDNVINKISEILRQRHFRSQTNRPHASFLFVGPSGVGKSYLAKKLATSLFHHDDALLTLNMSEFTQSHSSSKLLGSPAGYVGYKDRNHFIDQLKKRPHSVVLFDEIDKAHPDIIKLLLQILDDGVITDNTGEQISFAHAIIILTANVSEKLYDTNSFGFDIINKQEANKSNNNLIKKSLEKKFSKSIISRLDHVGIFNKLNQDDLVKIAQKQIKQINTNLLKKQYPKIKASTSILKKFVLTNNKNNTKNGREIEREIENMIHKLLAQKLTNQNNSTSNNKTHYNLKNTNKYFELV